MPDIPPANSSLGIMYGSSGSQPRERVRTSYILTRQSREFLYIFFLDFFSPVPCICMRVLASSIGQQMTHWMAPAEAPARNWLSGVSRPSLRMALPCTPKTMALMKVSGAADAEQAEDDFIPWLLIITGIRSYQTWFKPEEEEEAGSRREEALCSSSDLMLVFAGAFGVMVGYPFDTVKVYGFYKGMTMPVIAVSLSFSLAFGTSRNVLQYLCKLRHGSPEAQPDTCDIFLSGLAGGIAQVLLVSPADMVKVRLQCQRVAFSKCTAATAPKPKYHGPIHCLRTIACEEGTLGLYKGAQALALRDGPFFATFLTSYHIICEQLTPPGRTDPEWRVVLLAGGLSGICGWCVGTPMDLIKARLQMDWIGQRRYRGFLHCITDSVRSEGPGVFFRGLSLNCMRAVPSTWQSSPPMKYDHWLQSLDQNLLQFSCQKSSTRVVLQRKEGWEEGGVQQCWFGIADPWSYITGHPEILFIIGHLDHQRNVKYILEPPEEMRLQ
ncbi:hypothetical protein INR49_019897 [Caranx melampygus]|nr:hypothetical protein INR49_019897 [Caranx melampygus]